MSRLLLFTLVSFLLIFGTAASQEAGADEYKLHANLRYCHERGSGIRNYLDLYVPKDGTDHGVVLWVHGGAWKIGSKRAVNDKPNWLCQQGFALASINYRLHPKANFEDQATDISFAMKWLVENAKKYELNKHNIYLMGHSAGAHLVALVGTDETWLKKAGLSHSKLKGVICIDTCGYDIPAHIETARKRSRETYESVFTTDKKTQQKASPITYVKKGRRFPDFLVLYVASRNDAKLRSIAFADKLRSSGNHVQIVSAKQKTHMTINRELGKKDDEPSLVIEEFLNARQRKK